MRVVLQRVTEASVKVGERSVASIGEGLLLLAAFTAGDGRPELDWMARKILGLRIFSDDEGKMNRSVEEAGGEILVVSQFTLYGDTRKGRRPSFVRAAHPETARRLYDAFVVALREGSAGCVAEGEFGAMMDVSLVNAGPVTLVIDRGPAAARPPGEASADKAPTAGADLGAG